MPPDNLIDRVVRVLGNYPMVQFQREADSIEVPPASPEGFHVSISTENGARVVCYAGWHDDFDNDDDALNCFMLGLTPTVRLKVTRRCGYEHKWSVEVREGDRWKASGTVGLVLFPFWRRKDTVTLQNGWLEAPDPASKV